MVAIFAIPSEAAHPKALTYGLPEVQVCESGYCPAAFLETRTPPVFGMARRVANRAKAIVQPPTVQVVAYQQPEMAIVGDEVPVASDRKMYSVLETIEVGPEPTTNVVLPASVVHVTEWRPVAVQRPMRRFRVVRSGGLFNRVVSRFRSRATRRTCY